MVWQEHFPVVLFIITSLLSLLVFKVSGNDKRKGVIVMAKSKKDVEGGLGIHARRAIAYIVLIIISFFCLFWFYIMFINATRSKGELKAGFTALPSDHLLTNWNNLVHGTLPIWSGMFNSLIIAAATAVLCVYFSTMTAYAIHAYDFKLKKFIYPFILMIMMIPTQVTALGFIKLITGMGLMDSFIPLIVPAIASPFFLHETVHGECASAFAYSTHLDVSMVPGELISTFTGPYRTSYGSRPLPVQAIFSYRTRKLTLFYTRYLSRIR